MHPYVVAVPSIFGIYLETKKTTAKRFSIMIPTSPLIPVGISACLLGEKVRYDGNHKYNHDLITALGRFFKWVSVCPEVEMGLAVPRETMYLVIKDPGDIRLVTPGGTDYTSVCQTFAKSRVASLAGENICGFILKSGSPSCGLKEVPLFNSTRKQVGVGQGLFVSILLNCLPHLPVEEAEHLHNPQQRESFISQVLAYHDRVSPS